MTTLDKLQEIITVETLRNDGVPSASIAILEDSKISTCMVTHHQDDTNTVYQAASISKAITAIAVARLIDDGHFTYDTLVAEHLPQRISACLAGPGADNWIEQVTVRMLVSHTSGLSQGGWFGYTNTPPTAENVLAGKPPANTPKVRFEAFPGAQFKYSGGGWLVLQLFLEAIMDQDFATLMRTTLIAPLGMTRSFYGDLPHDEQNYANAYKTVDSMADAPYHKFPELASGGLWTTPGDLLKAIAAVQKSLASKSGFIKSSTAREMLTGVKQSGAEASQKMALGWGSDNDVFAHRGLNFPGYNTYALGSHGGVVNNGDLANLVVPAGNGIAVMTNGELGWDAVTKIVSAVFYLKGWRRFGSLPSIYGSDDYIPAMALADIKSDSDWRDWCGMWDDDWTLADLRGPAISFRGCGPVLLKLAAAPVYAYGGGRHEHMFVAEHIRVTVRLTWDEDERIFEVIQADSKTVHRDLFRK